MGWQKSSDGMSKDKITVDEEKGRVTHERIDTTGSKHGHEWDETTAETTKSGSRGPNADRPSK